MKQYVVDELRPEDYERLKNHLDETLQPAGLDGLYWLEVQPELLTGIQEAHMDCRPLLFAIELEPDRLSCELLVRTKNRVRCQCMAYATETQRNWLIAYVDAMLEQLDVIS